MSEHLTHIAVYEDCARLILNTDKFCEAFRTCVRNQYDSGLTTSGTRGNHLYAVPILDTYKDRWEQVTADAKAQQQMAGAIGWITHRAADLQMKPTWRTKVAENADFPESEMQIYHDSVTFREVYGGGARSTGSPYEQLSPHTLEKGMASHPASRLLNINQVEELITYLYQKEFVELHTFHDSRDNIHQWLNDFVEYHQEYTEDLRIYIEAFQHPDPEKMESYVYSINYYNPEDPLLQWVRGIQTESDVSHIDLEKALEEAATQSHYARAIRKGFLFTHAASEYFSGRLEKTMMYDTLELGPNERD